MSVPAEKLEQLAAEARAQQQKPSEIVREQIEWLKGQRASTDPAAASDVVGRLAELVARLESTGQ